MKEISPETNSFKEFTSIYLLQPITYARELKSWKTGLLTVGLPLAIGISAGLMNHNLISGIGSAACVWIMESAALSFARGKFSSSNRD